MRILDLVKPKDLARVSKLQLLARQVVEGFARVGIAHRTKGLALSSKNTELTSEEMNSGILIGRPSGKAIDFIFVSMKRKPTFDVPCW